MGNDFSASKVTKARRTHECEECGRDIHPGQDYRRDSGLFNGHMWASKFCLPCAALVDWSWANDVFDYENGREFGGMLTALVENELVQIVEVWADNDEHDFDEVRLTEQGARWLEIDPSRNFPQLKAAQ